MNEKTRVVTFWGPGILPSAFVNVPSCTFATTAAPKPVLQPTDEAGVPNYNCLSKQYISACKDTQNNKK
jgi:hypothetical protein